MLLLSLYLFKEPEPKANTVAGRAKRWREMGSWWHHLSPELNWFTRHLKSMRKKKSLLSGQLGSGISGFDVNKS